eukprot:764488-Hanusia_phi.AAC.2
METFSTTSTGQWQTNSEPLRSHIPSSKGRAVGRGGSGGGIQGETGSERHLIPAEQEVDPYTAKMRRRGSDRKRSKEETPDRTGW